MSSRKHRHSDDEMPVRTFLHYLGMWTVIFLLWIFGALVGAVLGKEKDK